MSHTPSCTISTFSDHPAAVETAITEDPVDIRIRKAFAPIVNPILVAAAREPVTADKTSAAVGPGTPLVRLYLVLLVSF